MGSPSLANLADELPEAVGIPPLLDDEFRALRDLIYRVAGIALAPGKRQLVASRLGRRLRHYGYRSFAEYHDHLTRRDPSGVERQQFINCITTNKTDFFREPHHFDFLRDVAIPRWQARADSGGPRRVRIWSAGCSSGQEPYSIAMTLLEHLGAAFEIEVLATDIDTDVLAKAAAGVYPVDQADPVPPGWLPKYFLRGVGPRAGEVRVRPAVRDRVTFRQLNLNEAPWDVPAKLDAIFCRNVVIYFDRQTQQRLFGRYADQLSADGFLFIGHSENLLGVCDRFVPAGAPTVYRPVGGRTPVPAVASTAPSPPAATPPAPAASEPADAPPPPSRAIIAGEVFASREPTVVQTLLGSCVAACLYDPIARVGGMNHFLLPGDGSEGISARYGVNAMEVLINKIMALGGDRRRLVAKVFGAGNVLAESVLASRVGKWNEAFVLKFLEVEGIPVAGRLLGCASGLRVRFNTDTGKAWAKPLEDTQLGAVAAREKLYVSEAAREAARPRQDSITLF